MRTCKQIAPVVHSLQTWPAGDLMDLPLQAIRRPLGRTRSNGKHAMFRSGGFPAAALTTLFCADQDKVQALIESIQEIGLKEPVSLSVKHQY